MKKRRRISQCPNCNTQLLKHENFCPNCGQENHTHNNSMRELWHDFIGSLFNFDGKIWTTLSTLFLSPGKVSKDYVEGKKIRYVPPLRMYIFVSAICFLVLNYSADLVMNSKTIESILRIRENAIQHTRTILIPEDDWSKVKDYTPAELDSIAPELIKKINAKNFPLNEYLSLKKINGIDSVYLANEEEDRMISLSNGALDIKNGVAKRHLILFLIKPEYDSIKVLDTNVSYEQLVGVHQGKINAEDIVKNQSNDITWDEEIGTSNMIESFAAFRLGSFTEKKQFFGQKAHNIINALSYSMLLLMPIAAFIFYLFYFRKYKQYYPHFVLTIHLHIMVFITFAIMFLGFALSYTLFNSVGNGLIPLFLLALSLGQFIYYLFSVKYFYGQGWKITFVKTSIMNLIYTFLFFSIISLVFYISILFA